MAEEFFREIHSYLLFSLPLNPIIQLAQSLNTCEFQPRMLNCLLEMPMTNSYIYALWDEPNSEEPVGWYLAKGTSIEDDGSICLKYRKENLTEVTKPTELKWHPACSTNKWFQSLNDITDTSPMCLSKPHIADDLTTFQHPPVITQKL